MPTYQAGPLPTSDDAPTGATAGKTIDGRALCADVIIITNTQGGPAPFNVQTPPKTTGRPI